MLGIIKPYKMELLLKDCVYYKLYYCSICRHLVKNNNRLYAFLNSYEGTLLAMLYNEMVVQDVNAVKDRCSGMPIAPVAALPPDHEAVELGALICLLAFQVKFQDNLMDETGFWIRRYNGFLNNHVKRSFTHRDNVYRKFNIDLARVKSEHQALHRLEQDESVRDINVYLSRWADLFAYIMTQAFVGKIEEARLDALKRFFAGLGRVINLIDSMTDLHPDHQSGSFNLILRAEPAAQELSREWLEANYQKYAKVVREEQQRLVADLPALQLRESYDIVNNILTRCLDNEMQKVFESMVLKKQKTERLLFNCKDF